MTQPWDNSAMRRLSREMTQPWDDSAMRRLRREINETGDNSDGSATTAWRWRRQRLGQETRIWRTKSPEKKTWKARSPEKTWRARSPDRTSTGKNIPTSISLQWMHADGSLWDNSARRRIPHTDKNLKGTIPPQCLPPFFWLKIRSSLNKNILHRL